MTRARRHVAHDPGFRRDAGAFADRQMPADRRLSANPREITDLAGAGDASLRDDHAAASDRHVVADLHEIVDLRALADDRVAQRAAVDRRIGADLQHRPERSPAEFAASSYCLSRRARNQIRPVPVALDDLTAVYDRLASVGLATPNAGLISDIIACPGLDYCALATARSIPVAQRLSERFGDGARARAIGPLKIKISGCINACGHHHVGHIGILGLERAGEETYQITLGGSGDETASIGQIIGPGFSSETVVGAVETIVDTYMARRSGPAETFLDAYRRLGPAPFKEALYNRNAGADI